MYTPSDSLGKVNLMLDLISQKQRALSANISNVDTPGYVRKDIKFEQYLGTMNSPLETELSSRLGPSAIIEEREEGVIDPARELTEMQKNSLIYSVAARRMTTLITEFKTVINVGK